MSPPNGITVGGKDICSTCQCSAITTLLDFLKQNVDGIQGKVADLSGQVNNYQTQLNSMGLHSSTLHNTLAKQIGDLQSMVTANHMSLQDIVSKQHNDTTQLIDTLTIGFQSISQKTKAKDCADLYKKGERQNDVYIVYPTSGSRERIAVYCDMATDGGGWTVFQRRENGKVDFYRNWTNYSNGFGRLYSEFWLGNDVIHQLTTEDNYELRIDMRGNGTGIYAKYDKFAITSDRMNYQLILGKYSGNAGDSFSGHKGYEFSTKDKDNDVYSASCANRFKGGWWYSACHSSNLNGLYHDGAHTSYADGVNWSAYRGQHYSLEKTEMKFRPVGFQGGY